jgi:hypothetical protein
MPMAPILLEKNLDYFFHKEEYLKCIHILKYMIMSLKYNNTIDQNKYSGIIHNHPIENYYTGRPQVLFNDQKNHILYESLQILSDLNIKALINTSFNIHGLSTCLLLKHIVYDFLFQKNNDIDNKILLIFITKYSNYYNYFYNNIINSIKEIRKITNHKSVFTDFIKTWHS